MRIKNVPLGRVKAGPDDGLAEGEFIVYPSTFTRQPDSYGDVVAKGAFTETIQQWKNSGDTLPGLFGHRMDDPDFYIASALDLGEDDHGWWVKGAFDMESPKGPHTYRLVKSRRLRQLSFAFDVLEEGAVELEDGTKANELRKLRVHEFSFVPIGANQDTSVVAIKALAENAMVELKAGRVLSAKNESTLREALTQIQGSAQQIKDVLSATEPAGNDQEKASGTREVNDEEPGRAKSEEPSASPSAKTLAEAFELEVALA
ncbi:HK97 family phage prohead protease [Micrococcus sp. IITD107]|uniref:HK97 family phage prohead protease n=1 Tax=Micrococcus sp. IITD107 TaxID=3342790 RepID=UPI0035BB9481